MRTQDELRMREWCMLKYFDPRRTLTDLRAIEIEIAGCPMDDKVRALRTHTLWKYNEWRQAALFCYGISGVLGTIVYFAPHEAEGYDYITVRVAGDTQTFTPLQLKELVPAHTNPGATLGQILASLTKYATSRDTVVAIYINRRQTMDLASIVAPSLNIGELWLFWAASEDQSKWNLYGDLLKDPVLDEFDYPT